MRNDIIIGMYDLISIGNIAIDLFYKGDNLTFKDERFQLAIGGKYFVDFFHESIGGGGTNVAIGVQKHGLKTALVGKIGENDFSKLIFSKLQGVGVDTSLCQIEKEFLNISSILLNEKGERSIINYQTPHQHIIKDKNDLNKLLNTKLVYFGNLPDVSLTERLDIMRFLHENNIPIVSNIGVNDVRRSLNQIEEFFKYINIFIINTHEFADLIKTNYSDIDFHQNVIESIPYLKDKIVLITDGEKGSYGYNDGRVIHQEAVQLDQIVDSTGCGDAYTAGFIAEYLKSKDLASSMLSGAKYAAQILSQIGAN